MPTMISIEFVYRSYRTSTAQGLLPELRAPWWYIGPSVMDVEAK